MIYRRIELFPNCDLDPFILTSPHNPRYNCIAWAFEDPTKLYWPSNNYLYHYWPKGLKREVTIDAFKQLFASIGYVECGNDGLFEEGYQKIALYADTNGAPTHAARQLPDGNWTSKLGLEVDFSHSLESLADGLYGNVVVFMKRERQPTPVIY